MSQIDPLMSTKHKRGSYTAGVPSDVAQLVERNLAKVEVAGSNPVIRSEGVAAPTVEWPRGEAAACKAAYTGSNPVSTSVESTTTESPQGDWRSGSALP